MIRTLTTFVAPMQMQNQGSMVNVEFPEVTIKERGKEIPVEVIK